MNICMYIYIYIYIYNTHRRPYRCDYPALAVDSFVRSHKIVADDKVQTNQFLPISLLLLNSAHEQSMLLVCILTYVDVLAYPDQFLVLLLSPLCFNSV